MPERQSQSRNPLRTRRSCAERFELVGLPGLVRRAGFNTRHVFASFD
jgi:hypothetical protein